jgi:hypothetical protein
MRGILVLSITALVGCSGGVATSSDVKLKNATAHMLSHATCPTAGGGNAACAVYQLTFAVVNEATRAIDRVDDVQLSTGGQPLQNQTAIGCSTSPWTLPPGGASGVLTLDVTFGPQPMLAIECSTGLITTGGAVASSGLVSPPSAPSDSFELRVEGLLTDAQPFVATAQAPLL